MNWNKLKNRSIRLDELIPHDLFLLINFPILIGCFIDYNLIDFRYILINTIWIILFSITALLLASSIPNKIASIICFVIAFIETSHWILVGGPISVVSILTLGATNFNESMDFLSMKSSFSYLWLIPIIILFLYSLRQKRLYTYYKGKYLAVILVALGAIIFIIENTVNGRLVRKGVPQIAKVYYSFSEQYDFYKQTESKQKLRTVEVSVKNKEDNTFVLILGESLNRHHMSLYGYHRNTSPLLNKREDIIVYENVVAPYSNTINSVLSILSESNLENKMKQDQSIDVFDLFSSAGIKTFWLSNQPPYGIWENKITTLAKKADKVEFVNLSSNSSMEATLTSSFDSKLFDPLIKVLKSNDPQKLIVLHLIGNHSSYEKRYPNDYNIYAGTSRKEKTIAEYDNSVLYNDFVVDSLLNIILEYSEQNNTSASALYLSDHGENVYDENDQVGHTYAGKLPKANVDVPFIVWLSDNFKSSYPKLTSVIKKNRSKPHVADDLFHGLIELNHMETPLFKEKRSIFNAKYNDQRKRVLVDGKDYDE